ncbi:ATP-dependent DNA helicase [Streptomyces otsuchiensis]|uniref:ATP-dependent DNA helicase n=2 Tax=Streptomyces TaxID=1883 RepID=UPI001031CB8A|nr:ATP-dependent DNA helicase [Streptomyces otsuchiensis]
MPARLRHPEELKRLLGIPFTAEQIDAITAPPAPQVIVAGAGSGKTTVMAARVVWLVGTGQTEPERVLGLTFTNKAAAELSERVRRALRQAGVLEAPGAPAPRPAPGDPPTEEAPGEPEISTYHAFAGRLITEHGLRIGVEPASRLLADASRFQLAAEVLRAAPAEFTAPTGASTGNPRRFTALVEDLIALDGELSEHLVDPGALRDHDDSLLSALSRVKLSNAALRRVPETARGRRELLALVEEYRARKRSRDLIDFGDQIAHSARLARDVPEVGRALRERYSVVLLDEYQDTSVAQRIMLAGLFGAGAGADAGHAVTAVGDPCQAIYGWRGASVANLDDFPGHFPHAGGTPADRYTLTENRRSGGRLLELANGLAAPLRARHPGVEPLRPADGAEHSGRVRCALLPTQDEEFDWLGDHLAHLVRTGTPPGEIAVLCRTAADFSEIQRALVERSVPVEVVGLSGLLHLPEVADLVAVCEVLADPTANAALVRLLTGPRWRVGPRDLALLGRRARALVRREAESGADRLSGAVEGTDPAEVVSLADALDTFTGAASRGRDHAGPPGHPGARSHAGGDHGRHDGFDDDLAFSDEARVRFAHLAAELRDLRRSVSDPLMDVLHRVLAATGLEVELSASPQALAARRRETLRAFLDIAADYAAGGHSTAVDRDATLPAFLAYLKAAAQHDKGLDGSLPGSEDTVKVLTAHKAKGLEWDVVAVPGLYRTGFPQTRAQDSWLKHSHTLPFPLRGDAATLPGVEEWTSAALGDYDSEASGHRELEELRLGYVAFTRPRSLLLGSAHRWGPSQKKPRVPSPFLTALRDHCEASPEHGEVESWAPAPADGDVNPALDGARGEQPWPLPLGVEAAARRREAAELVLSELRGLGDPGAMPSPRRGADAPGRSGSEPAPDPAPGPGPAPESELSPEEQRAVESWDRDLDALAGELRRSRERVRDVVLPASLSASQLQWLAADPEGFARELARPMPHRPRPAARRGTRFHAWVESRFEALALPMLGPDELPGGEDDDPDIRDEHDLEQLKESFERGPFADRTPYQVEAPFQLRLAGRTVRGRIDAVYREGDRFEIIDWKTGHNRDADPLQLAVYRVAWAELRRIPLARVTAAFYYVRGGELVRPAVLPDRAGLEQILAGEVSWALNIPG